MLSRFWGRSRKASQVDRMRGDAGHELPTPATMGGAVSVEGRAPASPNHSTATVARSETVVGSGFQLNPDITAETAIRALVRELSELCGGNEFPFAILYDGYLRERITRGWPPVSKKKFGMTLAACGCIRRKLDNRSSGGGKPTIYLIPLQETQETVIPFQSAVRTTRRAAA